MPHLAPTQGAREVLTVLRDAARGKKGSRPHYVTAYQILARLQPALRRRIERERTPGGRGNRHHYSAATLIGQAAKALGRDVETACVDTEGLRILAGGRCVQPGYRVCNLYRLRLT